MPVAATVAATGAGAQVSMPPIGLRSFPSEGCRRTPRARTGSSPSKIGSRRRGGGATRDVADSDGSSVAERERRRVVPVMRFVSGAARVHRASTFAATESSYRAAARLCGLVGTASADADLYCDGAMP